MEGVSNVLWLIGTVLGIYSLMLGVILRFFYNRITSRDSEITLMKERISGTSAKMNGHLESSEERRLALNDRLHQGDDKFKTLENEVKSVNKKVEGVGLTCGVLSEQVKSFEHKLDAHTELLDTKLQSVIHEFKGEIRIVSTEVNGLSTLIGKLSEDIKSLPRKVNGASLT